MKDKNIYSRKSFLRTAGSTALFAALGIQLTSCAGDTMNGDDGGNGGGGGGGGSNLPDGVSVSGQTITIDLTKQPVSHLADAGEHLVLNGEGTGILAVNVDGQTIRAFTSTCTHQHCTTGWSYDKNSGMFTCRGTCGHGSDFNNSGEWVSGADGQASLNTGDLEEYTVSRSGNTVTVTK